MIINKVYAVYFSPTGNTKKITVRLAQTLAEKFNATLEEVDFTVPASRESIRTFYETDLVVFGTPVYAGRVPNKVLPMIQSGFAGGGALAVPVISWGNRNFDNALIELRNELEGLGFHTIAGAGVVSAHTMSDKIAVGHPNGDDFAELEFFGEKIAKKILRAEQIPPMIGVRGDDPIGPYYTPLGLDGQPAKFLKAKPKTVPESCVHCGKCAALCPMHSIDDTDSAIVDGICIKCHSCIRNCPQNAKFFDDPQLLSHIAYLEAHYADLAKPSEFFI